MTNQNLENKVKTSKKSSHESEVGLTGMYEPRPASPKELMMGAGVILAASTTIYASYKLFDYFFN
ncbi:hypothetical protein J4407_01620 [Candidatus Pacearchaeota archaeon]|nr:hypothetical protein [Candidatus Pacearchaeota archaeon]